MRPKLYKLLPEYLVPYENPRANHAWKRPKGFQSDNLDEDMTRDWPDLDRSVGPVAAWKGGTHTGLARLRKFVEIMLPQYELTRNHPEMDGTSAMSPYLHYGHVGPQTIALAVQAAAEKNPALTSAKDSYFNELIAWRELSINFVKYDPNYDSVECAADWAKATLAEHAPDERPILYTLEQLEAAETFDELWNAAQTQMVEYGWMHNYMRMYWGKKIVAWTPDVSGAYRFTAFGNVKDVVDGRDPNGYSGVAWAIVRKFDKPWFERAVFGKVRYMSGASTGKKFDSKGYIAKMKGLRAER